MAVDHELKGGTTAVILKGAKVLTVRAVDDALAVLSGATKAELSYVAQGSANAISLAILDLYDLYSESVSNDVRRLCAALKLLRIDVAFSHWTIAVDDLEYVDHVWVKVRSVTEAHARMRPHVAGSPTVVAEMDEVMADVKGNISAQNGAAAEAAVQKGLRLAGVIRNVFEASEPKKNSGEGKE